MKTFFRHCPACGRRFEIRLESKTLVDEKTIEEDMPQGPSFPTMAREGGVITSLQQEVPTIVDEKEFQYRYRCTHCGHEWTEVRETVSEAGAKGYTGD